MEHHGEQQEIMPKEKQLTFDGSWMHPRNAELTHYLDRRLEDDSSMEM